MKTILLMILLTISVLGFAQEKPRIFITDSQSWAAVGGFGAVNGTGAGAMAAGSSPQTVEVIDDFAKQCPNVTVTNDRAVADFIVLFDRDAAAKANTLLARADKIAVFRKNGDLVYSGKSRSVVNTVKDTCAALGRNRKESWNISVAISPLQESVDQQPAWVFWEDGWSFET